VTRVGKAHRAIEVAAGVDLDDPEAGVLLVVGAQAAVERAAVTDLGLGLERDRARLVEALRRHVHLGVAVQQRLEGSVVPTPLAQEHLVVAGVDLGVDHRLAHGADALRALEEHLVTVDTLTRG